MGTADLERLGEAHVDGESNQVPVPQRAFDLELLRAGEVFWAAREADDAVMVAGRYDPIDESDALTFLGSSRIADESRLLSIPDTVLDRWGSAAGGERVIFATSSELRTEGQCLVLPAEQAAAAGIDAEPE